MSRSLWTLWIAVAALSALGLTLTAPAALRANARMDRELAKLATAKLQAEEIDRLRVQSPPWTTRPRPGGELATRIAEALAAASLPATALASLSPGIETDAGGGSGLKAKRRRVVLTLGGVTLPQVGGFLAAWRELEPGWIVANVELVQDPSQRPPAGGGDMPLRATIALEALYADQNEGTRR